MRIASRFILSLVVAALAVMWVYALVFASKEAVNKIDDEAWAARAEVRCAAAKQERMALIDLRRFDAPGAGGLVGRAALVDLATDTIERMLVDISETMPTDPKGMAIVPLWLDEYRTYVGDRRAYADQLRRGDNAPFAETAFEGLPLAERLATFAGDNRMPSCAPPIDLSV